MCQINNWKRHIWTIKIAYREYGGINSLSVKKYRLLEIIKKMLTDFIITFTKPFLTEKCSNISLTIFTLIHSPLSTILILNGID